MKILIAYASKTGTAAECAERLARELQGADVTLADLSVERPDPTGFDAVIVGGSIRYGKLHAALRDCLTERADALAAVPHGLFLCCANGHEFEEHRDRLLPRALCESAFAVLSFGGRLKLARASLWERFLLHTMRSRIVENEMEVGEYTPAMPDILPENISRMAAATRAAYGKMRNGQSDQTFS